VITSGGNRNPANADRWTFRRAVRGRRTHPASSACPSLETRAGRTQQTQSGQQPVHHERSRRCLGTRVLAFDLHRRLATSPGVSPGLGWSWRLGEDRPHSFGPAPRRRRTHGAADRRLCVGRGSRARMSSASVVHPWRPLDQIGGRRQGRLRRIRLRGLGSRSTRGTGSGAILLVLHGRTG
jgi:hypothetical protein